MSKVIKDSTEIYLSTAYLTDWSIEFSLPGTCKRFSFLFGTDFGITRKAAVQALLKWTPKHFLVNVRAVDQLSGFHPKVIFGYLSDGSHFLLAGSSNQTSAGFGANVEANVFMDLTTDDYNKLKKLFIGTFSSASPVSEDWLLDYVERSSIPTKKRKWKVPKWSGSLSLGKKKLSIDLEGRREQQKSFKRVARQILNTSKKCASGKISNEKYYEYLNELWSWDRGNRFQGRGFEIKAKHSDWKVVCKALISILESGLNGEDLDELVRQEMDYLAEVPHPARRSWFTEMLCHFYPSRFPVLNSPIDEWLKLNKRRGEKGASEGSSYIGIAKQVRECLQSAEIKSLGIRDLAELDAVIWELIRG
jgi:hypothetical protein